MTTRGPNIARQAPYRLVTYPNFVIFLGIDGNSNDMAKELFGRRENDFRPPSEATGRPRRPQLFLGSGDDVHEGPAREENDDATGAEE